MKPGMYLRPTRLQVLVLLSKIWSQACIWGLASCMHLFSHPKYEARHVLETCLVASTCFSIKNKNLKVYLQSVTIYPTKIWGPEAWLVVSTCFPTQKINRNIYLRPGWLRLLAFLYKIWDAICIWGIYSWGYLFSTQECEGCYILRTSICLFNKNRRCKSLAGLSYLFSHPKYEMQCVSRACSVGVTRYFIQNVKRNVYLRLGHLTLLLFLLFCL